MACMLENKDIDKENRTDGYAGYGREESRYF